MLLVLLLSLNGCFTSFEHKLEQKLTLKTKMCSKKLSFAMCCVNFLPFMEVYKSRGN